MKNVEMAADFIIPEIPPIFKAEKFAASEKSGNNVLLYQAAAAALIIVLFIILKIFFPEVYVIINSWITQKLALPSLSL